MDDELLDQLFWRFARRLSEVLGPDFTGIIRDPRGILALIQAVADIMEHDRSPGRFSMAYDAGEWLLAMLELCRVGGVFLPPEDPRVLEVIRLLKNVGRGGRTNRGWRARLAKSYIERSATEGAGQMGRNDRNLLVMSEYMCLVDDLTRNPGVNFFLRQAHFPGLRRLGRLRRLSALARNQLLNAPNRVQPRLEMLFEGAAMFLAVAGNCRSLLEDLPDGSAMRSA